MQKIIIKNGVIGKVDVPNKPNPDDFKELNCSLKALDFYKAMQEYQEALAKAIKETFVPFEDQAEIDYELFLSDKVSLYKRYEEWKVKEGAIYDVPEGYKVEFETNWLENDIRQVAILTPIKEELSNINVGDEVYLYGKKTKVIGFKESFNEALDTPHEVIIITEGRCDPFLRTFKSGNLKLVEKQEYKNTCFGCGRLYNPLDEKECDYHNSGRCEKEKQKELIADVIKTDQDHGMYEFEKKVTSEEIGKLFEKEFGTRSDYFNHRLGLFMEIKKWIISKQSEAEETIKFLRQEIEYLKKSKDHPF
jgi:hypothetical protein